jgi:hypothetical protein
MKKIKKLRIFGGSTSVPENFVNSDKSFWGLAAKALGVDQVINYSWVGCSFDSICHILVSEQTNFNWHDDFFLIVIPPLERLTIFDGHKNTQAMSHVIDTVDWSMSAIEIMSHHGLTNISFRDDKSTVIFEDRSWTEVDALRNVFFLNKWLDSLHVEYLIVNGSKPFDSNNIWMPSNFLLPYCSTHVRNCLFSNTYSSVNVDINMPPDFKTHGWNGHHSSAGNQRFFELGILPKLKELNLC